MFNRAILGFVLAAGAFAQPPARIPSIESIVERITQARQESRARLRPYEVVRSYKLFRGQHGGQQQKAKSEITAEITYVPPDGQHFRVHKAVGWGFGEVVVRKVLERENELLANQAASDISAANYSFTFVREDTL